MEENTPEQIEETTYNKIPLRVKEGNITDNTIQLKTSKEVVNINFEQIEYIYLGCINEKIASSDPPRSGLRNMIRGLLIGKDKTKEAKIKPEVRVVKLLDIYVKNSDAPYRIDASAVNYKNFLTKLTYRSEDNFRLLVKSICSKAKKALFNQDLVKYISSIKYQGKQYPSTNDFTFFSCKERAEKAELVPWSSIDFEKAPDPPSYEE